MRNRLTIQQHRDHFLERLQERHGITITKSKYAAMRKEKFKGFLAKNHNKTIGIKTINDVEVCVLYDRSLRCFVTCYPADVLTNVESMMWAAFGTGNLRKVADRIYGMYLSEQRSIRFDFETEKEAGLFYYEHTMFSPLHMYMYKYKEVKVYHLIQCINAILRNKHPRLHLTLKIREKHLKKDGATK